MFQFLGDKVSQFFLISELFPSASGIKLRDVVIPPHAIRGQDAKLQCRYDLEVGM